jgi:hypothetical protein
MLPVKQPACCLEDAAVPRLEFKAFRQIGLKYMGDIGRCLKRNAENMDARTVADGEKFCLFYKLSNALDSQECSPLKSEK